MTLEAEIDAAVGRWHLDTETKLSLREYLGMTQEQYADWVCTARIPDSYTAVPVMPAVEGLDDAPQAKEAP